MDANQVLMQEQDATGTAERVVGAATAAANPVAVTQAPKASYQTMKTFTFLVSTSTTVTTVQPLYTVTNGKTFYLTDISVCNNTGNAATVSINASSAAGASPIAYGHTMNTAPWAMVDIATEPSVSGGNPVTFQAQPTTAQTTLAVTLSGYEQ